MLHHVSLELDPSDSADFNRLMELVGFQRIEAPAVFEGAVKWYERDGTQIHLIETPEPAAPALGHAALAVDDYEDTVEALRSAGFEVAEARQLWGEKRSFVQAPGGHRIELMEAPTPSVQTD